MKTIIRILSVSLILIWVFTFGYISGYDHGTADTWQKINEIRQADRNMNLPNFKRLSDQQY